jgi:hypothetical protein
MLVVSFLLLLLHLLQCVLRCVCGGVTKEILFRIQVRAALNGLIDCILPSHSKIMLKKRWETDDQSVNHIE